MKRKSSSGARRRLVPLQRDNIYIIQVVLGIRRAVRGSPDVTPAAILPDDVRVYRQRERRERREHRRRGSLCVKLATVVASRGVASRRPALERVEVECGQCM